MFYGCTSLTSWNGSLQGCTKDAYEMFNGCKLDVASVQRIADTIATYVPPSKKSEDLGNSGTITIHVDKSLDASSLQTIRQHFSTIQSKGWTVQSNI